jgi:hypothetical protein
MNKTPAILNRPFVPYVLPFLFLLIFIYLAPLVHISKGIIYPIQTLVLAGVLFYFRHAYLDEIKPFFDLTAILAGMLVFAIWILPDGYYPLIGSSQFNPYEYATGGMVMILIAFRLAGAVLVIPLMEELFWRSFAMRFLVQDDFKAVPLGQFTLKSFLVTAVAFGFEHHHWLPGIIAGMIYAGVLYRTKNLFSPIIAHMVTNLLLGIYVLMTEQWRFW